MLSGIQTLIDILKEVVSNMSHDDLVNFAIVFMLICALVINHLIGW